jgi:DnaJ-class molecular chaperone
MKSLETCCPDCDGQGVYKGLSCIEDPCTTCGGNGQVIREDVRQAFESHDLSDAKENMADAGAEMLSDMLSAAGQSRPFEEFLDLVED